MKRIVFAIVAAVMVFAQMFAPFAVLVHAQVEDGCNKASGAFAAVPTWYKYLKVEKDASGRCGVQEFNFPDDAFKVAIALLEILLYVAGVVAFCAVVWMGFKFVLSRGNPSEAAKARQGIIDAVIGLAIAISATVIVGFIGTQLKK